MDQTDRAVSRSSLDSHEAIREENTHVLKRGTSIIKGSLSGLEEVDGLEIDNGNDDIAEENIESVANENDGDEKLNECDNDKKFVGTPDSPSEHRLLSR